MALKWHLPAEVMGRLLLTDKRSSVGRMPAVGDLVQTTTGQWMDPPPQSSTMKVLKCAVVLLIALLGTMAGASAVASAAPDTQADVTYLHLLDQNAVSYPSPEAMVSFADDLVDQLSASPQNDTSVGSIVNTGEQRVSQHDMGVIIAAAVVAYRPSLIPVVRHWADSAAGFPCGSAAQGVLR